MTPSSDTSGALRVVGLMCLAEVLSMTGFAAYPAFLALLRDTWGISNSEAGFIGGAFFGGYMIAVPILSSLTDRFDARRVYMLSCALSGVSAVGFAFFAGGVVTAALLQALAGAGLAGTYMPGLKALTDRVAGPRQSRYIAFYTSTFGIGTSLSLLLAGWLGGILSWRWAFGLIAVGPVAAVLLVIFGLRPLPPAGADARRPALLRLDVVLRDRSVMGYILGYSVHCWELFGLRSWMVAFIVFAYGLAQARQPWLSATEAAAIINLIGLPASILGNEAAGRLGRLALHWRRHDGVGVARVAGRLHRRLALVDDNPLADGLFRLHHGRFRRPDGRARRRCPAEPARCGHGGVFLHGVRSGLHRAAGLRRRARCRRRQGRRHAPGGSPSAASAPAASSPRSQHASAASHTA